MEDKITNILKEYGLDEKEVKIYASLVERGELNAYTLAKITGIHRSTAYAVIERLSSRGFISKIEKGEKTFYSAIEISKIIAKIKEKESLLLSIIPELEKIRQEGISRVKLFDSKESQKQFNFNLFNQISKGTIKELYILSGGPSSAISEKPKNQEDLTSQIFMEGLLKELKKQKSSKKIEYKGIWNEKLKRSKLLNLFSGLGEDRFLKELPTLATMVIFGEYVTYLFTMNGIPQVIEIQNKLIAEENKAYFSYLWKLAR